MDNRQTDGQTYFIPVEFQNVCFHCLINDFRYRMCSEISILEDKFLANKPIKQKLVNIVLLLSFNFRLG